MFKTFKPTNIVQMLLLRLKGDGNHGVGAHFCAFSHSFMRILAHLKDMCSIRVPLSSTLSISVPTLASLPPETERAKPPCETNVHNQVMFMRSPYR